MFAKQNSALTLFKPKPVSLRRQLLSAGGFFLLSVITGLVLIISLNEGTVNHVFSPIGQQLSLFIVLWDEKPLWACRYILTRSVVIFAHQEPRSGLNLWTYQFDTITLLVYLLISLFGSRLLLKFFSNPGKYRKATILGLFGCVMTLFSASYMTVIEHCSSANWVGFVFLYGLGFDEFQLYPQWQWLCAGMGALALAGSWLLLLRQPKDFV